MPAGLAYACRFGGLEPVADGDAAVENETLAAPFAFVFRDFFEVF